MSAADEERRVWFRREILPLEPSLRAYALRFCRRGEAEVDDLVHETFARAIAYQTWRDVDNPAGFVTRILKNLALDGQRRNRIASFVAVGDFDGLGLVDEQPGPELQVLSRDELRKLGEIIGLLPDQVRRVVTLRKVYDLPNREIAERLNLSVSTVEKHLAKGLRICSDELGRRENRSKVTSLEPPWPRRHRNANR